MLKINRLVLQIRTNEQSDPNVKFGFDLSFNFGLNIIAGHNTRGKSTISSCLYYGLGMEELLGGQNDKALDKALKTTFNIYDILGEVEKEYTIFSSILFLEIVGVENRIVTLSRYINPGGQANEKVKFISVIDGEIGNEDLGKTQFPLYLRGTNNNENEFGFYNWLSKFIGLPLPTVTNLSKKGETSPLYLQTIFPALFIEQTKGWSEFFATTPYYGIPKVKEKVIELILGLNELDISILKDLLNRKKRELDDAWKAIIYRIDLLTAEQNGKHVYIPEKITAEKNYRVSADILIKESETSNYISIEALIEAKSAELSLLRELPILTVGENKASIRQKLEKLRRDHLDFMARFKEFDITLDLQQNQLISLKNHANYIINELNHQKGIRKIFSEAIIKEEVYHTCPTCSQEISTDLISSEHVTIEKLTLNENISYLEGQKKLVESSIESLSRVVEEKELVRRYYTKNQRDLEDQIKLIYQELVTDDREFSEENTFSRVRLEKSISDYISVNRRFKELILSLEEVSDKYFTILTEENKFSKSIEEDDKILDAFESSFKFDFLKPFGYTSNPTSQISIQRTDPFKYFPVFKFYKEDKQPQSIRVNSSASDFVRSIWAYSLSLLVKGTNHPGILMFDEPGQHRIDSDSLKSLFKVTAAMKDKQVIIFTSVDKKQSDGHNYELYDLLVDLSEGEDYSIITLDELGKCIKQMA